MKIIAKHEVAYGSRLKLMPGISFSLLPDQGNYIWNGLHWHHTPHTVTPWIHSQPELLQTQIGSDTVLNKQEQPCNRKQSLVASEEASKNCGDHYGLNQGIISL